MIGFGAIRRQLLNVVYPDERNEASKGGHVQSRADGALLGYCKKDFIPNEAKQEIEAIEGLSNLAERRRRFKRLLEAGDNGVLESTIDFLVKTEFDTAVDLLLADLCEFIKLNYTFPLLISDIFGIQFHSLYIFYISLTFYYVQIHKLRFEVIDNSF